MREESSDSELDQQAENCGSVGFDRCFEKVGGEYFPLKPDGTPGSLWSKESTPNKLVW